MGWGSSPVGERANFDPTKLVQTLSRDLQSQYEIIQQLGTGAQGIASLVKKRNCDGDDALFVAKETRDMSKAGIEDFKLEFNKMCALRHPNCLKVLELIHSEANNQMFIISEYARGGDVYHYMHKMISN